MYLVSFRWSEVRWRTYLWITSYQPNVLISNMRFLKWRIWTCNLSLVNHGYESLYLTKTSQEDTMRTLVNNWPFAIPTVEKWIVLGDKIRKNTMAELYIYKIRSIRIHHSDNQKMLTIGPRRVDSGDPVNVMFSSFTKKCLKCSSAQLCVEK